MFLLIGVTTHMEHNDLVTAFFIIQNLDGNYMPST